MTAISTNKCTWNSIKTKQCPIRDMVMLVSFTDVHNSWFLDATSSSAPLTAKVLILEYDLFLIAMTSHWAPWRLKSQATRLFARPPVQAHIKENIKDPRHWPLWGESTGQRCIPLTKDQLRGKRFHWMTSSCAWFIATNYFEEFFATSLLIPDKLEKFHDASKVNVQTLNLS